MGRHSQPGDPAQDDVVTEELPAVPSNPTPPGSGRHRGSERETWAARRARRRARQPEHGRAGEGGRSHRPAPIALNLTAGAIALGAIAISGALVSDARPTTVTVRPERGPAYASVPTAGAGQAPVTSGPVARKSGLAAMPSRPVTEGARPSTSQSPSGGAPERPRLAGSPSTSTSPGGGGPSPTTSPAPADPVPSPAASRKCRKRWRG